MKAQRVRAWWWAAALALAFAPAVATAHPLAPALLDLHERGEGKVEVAWKLRGARSRAPIAVRSFLLPANASRRFPVS